MNIEAKFDPATEIEAAAAADELRVGMEELEVFAEDVEALDQTLDQLAKVSGEQSRNAVLRLKNELADFEPAITVVGQVKAGKTSLINAMAGRPDLLPSDVNPWTSVVTSLHLTPGEERAETGARFQFMTEEEWDRLTSKGGRIGELAGRAGADSELVKIQKQIDAMREKSRARLGRKFELLMGQEHEFDYFDKALLERYICLGDDFDMDVADGAGDAQGRFADITRSAELYLNCSTIPFRMCIRDTPGVNDTFMMREMITIKAVRDSRVCVVVLSATQALTSVDMALIRMIANLDSREVIIFINRVDELSDPAEQIGEIEESMRATLRKHDGPEHAEIIFGSAFWANKVLSGELEGMNPAKADALLSLAEAMLGGNESDADPVELVWEVSGLPRLMRAISSQIVQSLGNPCLNKIASSAVALGTSQHAAQTVMIQGENFDSSFTNMNDIRVEFDRIARNNIEELELALSGIFADYFQRADRAHATFVERATHSLLDHLERFGDEHVWEYDPTGLRMLLRSAYSTMGSKVRKVAQTRYEKAVCETAHLLYRGFGPAVEGIQIAVPEVPQIPSPVALGQTIALDFNDSWWTMWWRRTRGYKAFGRQFRKLIGGETEDFMTQMKDVQTSDIRADLIKEMTRYFEEQKDILLDLISGAHRARGADELFNKFSDAKRCDLLDNTVDTLRGFVT